MCRRCNGKYRRKYIRGFTACLLALALLLAFSPFSFAQNREAGPIRNESGEQFTMKYVPGEVIIKLKSGISPQSYQAQNLFVQRNLQMTKALPYDLVLLKGAVSVERTVAELASNPLVEYAQPNYIYKWTTNDPLYGQQWGVVNEVCGTRAPSAWKNYTQGRSDVVVAVIDSGVDYNHPDLKDNIWHNPGEIDGDGVDNDGNGYIDDVVGYDFFNGDNDPMDDLGHGTHVAGIVAMAADNQEGGVGIAPKVKIMALKAGDEFELHTDSIVSAINYAAQHGAQIVNMSFGGPEDDPDHAVYTAIKGQPDVLFVAAAGNGGNDGIGDDNDKTPHYPASYDLPNIISVAALAQEGALTEFSNFGAGSVDLAAPGEKIVSSIPVYNSEAGIALAVANEVYNYKVMFWGFGLEDLDDPSEGKDVNGVVYDSVVRMVYDFFGLKPTDTITRPVLVVDDDNSGNGFPDVRNVYLNSLSTAGYVYNYYEVPFGVSGPSVSADVYSAVIWFTGKSWGSVPDSQNFTANLTDTDQTDLINYLKSGGKLFLSGSDATYGIYNSEFYTNYLQALFATEYQNLFNGVKIKGVGNPYDGVSYCFGDAASFVDLLLPNAGGKAQVVLKYEPYASWSGTSMAAPFVS